METSNLLLNAKDIDNKKGIVSFYFADFNSVDGHGRRMDRNAFKRTINNNFGRFKHLMNHYNAIGKPMEVNTDAKGAYMVSKLSGAASGRDALIMYEEGMITEHSFGFNIIASHQEGDIEVVTEVKMFEASSLDTWGANPNTPTIALNAGQSELIKELQAINAVNGELLTLLKNQDKKEIITILNDISARLPIPSEYRASQKKSEIEEVISLLNEKY